MAILKLREKNDGIKLAMVIMYGRASKDDEVESIRKSINHFWVNMVKFKAMAF